jgi:hypothetical protein
MATPTQDLTRNLAIRRAIDELRPHADDEDIADVIDTLTTVGGETEDGGEAVEKAMLDMVAIEKCDRLGPEVKARARAARGQLGVAYLSKQASGAYTESSRCEQFEQVRKAERGLAA